jgi:hypothetical protein
MQQPQWQASQTDFVLIDHTFVHDPYNSSQLSWQSCGDTLLNQKTKKKLFCWAKFGNSCMKVKGIFAKFWNSVNFVQNYMKELKNCSEFALVFEAGLYAFL